MARPATYTEETKLSVCGNAAKSKLQANSERRAIINKIIDLGGAATIKVLEAHFGYDLKAISGALVRSGWLRIEE